MEQQTDPHDVEAWYQTNPSLGTIFTERSVADEIGDDPIDFNIQRLGLWLRYNLKSAISRAEWDELKTDTLPKLTGKLYAGIKFSTDGTSCALAVACRTKDNAIFVEAIGCHPTRDAAGGFLIFYPKPT